MEVSVVCALPDRQLARTLKLPTGTTAGIAIEHCGLQAEFPEIDFTAAPIGIHGRAVPRTTVLQHGDRVEIYRELRADPKEARRRRSSRRG
ncbi:MAG: RnfH family protein [Burkholderiales bacterium]|nr:RnfH family protein [Burkholderiales bacterium]